MNKPLKKGGRDLFVLVIGNAVLYLAAIVTLKVSTSVLSPAEMGRMSLILAVLLWFNVIFGGISSYVQRNLLAWDSFGLASKYVLRLILFMFIVSIAGGAGVAVLSNLVDIGAGAGPFWLGGIVFGFLFLIGLNTAFTGWFNLFRRRFRFMLFSNITVWGCLAVSALFCVWFGPSAESWLLGQILWNAFVLIASWFLIFGIFSTAQTVQEGAPNAGEVPSESFSAILRFVWPISVASLLLWTQQSAYRFALEGIAGLEVVGLFTVGFGLGMNFINRFEILFNQFYHPIFFSEIITNDAGKRAQAWNDYAYYLIPSSVLLSLYIILGGPFIAKLFVGDEFFRVAKDVIAWGVLSQLILVMMTMYSMAGIIERETSKFIMPNVAGVLAMLAGFFFLSGRDPYFVAGFSLCAGGAVSLAVMRLKMKQLLPVRFPAKRLAFALILSLPMVGFLAIARGLCASPGLGTALLVLVISGTYMLALQGLLAGKRFSLAEKISGLSRLESYLDSLYARVGGA